MAMQRMAEISSERRIPPRKWAKLLPRLEIL
jgi:hypothetical protein